MLKIQLSVEKIQVPFLPVSLLFSTENWIYSEHAHDKLNFYLIISFFSSNFSSQSKTFSITHVNTQNGLKKYFQQTNLRKTSHQTFVISSITQNWFKPVIKVTTTKKKELEQAKVIKNHRNTHTHRDTYWRKSRQVFKATTRALTRERASGCTPRERSISTIAKKLVSPGLLLLLFTKC